MGMHVYVCVRFTHVLTQVTENNGIEGGFSAFFLCVCVMKLKIFFLNVVVPNSHCPLL